jgi:hypothetical protein
VSLCLDYLGTVGTLSSVAGLKLFLFDHLWEQRFSDDEIQGKENDHRKEHASKPAELAHPSLAGVIGYERRNSDPNRKSDKNPLDHRYFSIPTMTHTMGG